jgi:glycosyltransferase involved in cell wall biosynthesis
MVKLPRITVVTPSYNQGNFLEKTMCSVFNQDYPDLEYIVLDGGSKDQSRQIIEKYANRLSYWRSAPDNGQAAAIAEGFDRATGEILCWINSDDLLLPGCLRKVGEQFARYEDRIQWLIGGVIHIDEKDYILRYCKAFADSFAVMLAMNMAFAQPSCFWRKSLYQEVGGLNKAMNFCFDYDLFLRFARISKPRRVSDYLSAFRLHSGAKTSRMEEIRQKENKAIREFWKLNISKPKWYLNFIYRVIRGKLTTKILKDPKRLEWPGCIP